MPMPTNPWLLLPSVTPVPTNPSKPAEEGGSQAGRVARTRRGIHRCHPGRLRVHYKEKMDYLLNSSPLDSGLPGLLQHGSIRRRAAAVCYAGCCCLSGTLGQGMNASCQVAASVLSTGTAAAPEEKFGLEQPAPVGESLSRRRSASADSGCALASVDA